MPAHPRQGHRWNDHRTVINGMLFRTRTGCPWRDLPDCYGNWKTVYSRHRRWSLDGSWEKILDRLRADAMRPRARSGRSARIPPWCGRTSTPPGARRARLPSWPGGAGSNDKNPPGGTGREALGRSRGGLTSKIHLVADRRCRPVSQDPHPRPAHDCPQFIPLMDAVRIARRGAGRPRAAGRAGRWPTRPTPPRPTAPTCAAAASGPSSRSRRTRRHTAATAAARGGRPPAFDPRATRTATPSSAASTS